jgi:hypothetical protein
MFPWRGPQVVIALVQSPSLKFAVVLTELPSKSHRRVWAYYGYRIAEFTAYLLEHGSTYRSNRVLLDVILAESHCQIGITTSPSAVYLVSIISLSQL